MNASCERALSGATEMADRRSGYIKLSGERLLFVRRLVLGKKYFEPQDYGAVRSFFDNVRLNLRRYRLNARTG